MPQGPSSRACLPSQPSSSRRSKLHGRPSPPYPTHQNVAKSSPRPCLFLSRVDGFELITHSKHVPSYGAHCAIHEITYPKELKFPESEFWLPKSSTIHIIHYYYPSPIIHHKPTQQQLPPQQQQQQQRQQQLKTSGTHTTTPTHRSNQ